jgi:hypothetical protein
LPFGEGSHRWGVRPDEAMAGEAMGAEALAA